MLNQEAETFLAGYPYSYTTGPLIETPEAIEKGINCQLLAHIILEEFFGIGLPKWLLSFELFFDTNFTRKLTQDGEHLSTSSYDFSTYNHLIRQFLKEGESIRLGDICFFTWSDVPQIKRFRCPKYYHIAIVTGFEDKIPILTHAVQFADMDKDTVVAWSLLEILNRPSGRYGRLMGIKRVLSPTVVKCELERFE